MLTANLMLFWSGQTSLTVGAVNSLAPISQKLVFSLTDGTTANKANRLYTATGTLAGAASTTIDLSAPGNDGLGQSITPTRIVAVLLINTGTVAITVGGAASNAWTGAFSGTVNLQPGGCANFVAPDANGFAIGGSSKNLKLLNTDGAITASYTLLMITSQ